MDTNSSESNQGESKEVGAPPFEVARPAIDPNRSSDEEQCCKVDAFEKRLSRNELMELLFGAVIAFAAVISAIVAFLQWHTMDRQLDEMRGNGQQTDRLIAQVAEQANVARVALEENRRQFQRDQRPYVIPRAIPKVLMPDQEIVVDLQSGNYGKTPAMKVGGTVGIFVGVDALMQAYLWFDNEAPKVFMRSHGAVIPPSTPASSIESIRSTAHTGRLISAQEFDSLMRQDWSIVVTFRQAYLDTAGKEYWTDFCVGRMVSGAIANCPQHNEVH